MSQTKSNGQEEWESISNQSASQSQQQQRSSSSSSLSQQMPQNQNKANVFEDQLGPYLNGPPLIRQLVKRTDNKITIDFDKLNQEFPIKKTATNICTNYFQNQQDYYTCDTCCYNSLFTTMCICTNCYVPELHIGHSISKRTSYSSDAYCDCGRPSRINQKAFCEHHKNYNKDIELEQDPNQKAKFIEFFTALYCLLQPFLSQNETINLLDKINEFLYKINKESCFYNRLTFKVMKQRSDWKNLHIENDDQLPNGVQMIFSSLCQNTYGIKCLTQMVADNVTRTQMACLQIKLRKNYGGILSSIQQQLFGEPSIFTKLAQENIFFENQPNRYTQQLKKGIQGEKVFKRYIKYIYENKQRDQYYRVIDNALCYEIIKFHDEQLSEFLVKTLLQIYKNLEKQNKKSPKKAVAKIRKKSIKSKKTHEDKQIQHEQSEDQSLSENDTNSQKQKQKQEQQQQQQQQQQQENYDSYHNRITDDSIIRIILYSMLSYGKGDHHKISQIYTKGVIKGVKKSQIQKFVSVLAQKSYNILIQADRQSLAAIMIPAMTIFKQVLNDKKFTQQQKIIKKFWHSVIDQDRTLISSLDSVYQLITYLMNINILTNQVKKYYMKSNGKLQIDYKDDQELFKSFLYETKNINKDDLWVRRQNKQLDFPNAGKILKNYCKFNQESEQFEYISEQRHPNVQLKFSIRRYNDDYQAILANTFKYSDKLKLNDKDGVRRILAQTLFNKNSKKHTHNIFTHRFKHIWNKGLNEMENNSYLQQSLKNVKCSYIYIFILITVDKLTQGEISEIQKQLQNIRNNEEERFKYNYLAEPEDISRLLCLQDIQKEEQQEKAQSPQKKKQIEEKQQEQKLRQQQRKKKLQQLKKKKYQKFSKQRETFLKKNLSRTQSLKVDDDQELCILCHQRKKQDNQLVYLGEINKDNTLSGAFYGQQNKTQSFVNICFHTIHIKCFTKMDSQECPLCSKKVNCVFPINYSHEQKKLNRICSNIIISVMVTEFKVYDIENHFIFLFKHLVESYGLNSLISVSKYEMQRKQKTKTDKFILDFLCEMYSHATPQQIQSYNQSVMNLINQISNCKKKIFHDIQQFLTNLVYAKIKQESFQKFMPLMRQLKKQLTIEQYDILEQQCQKLTQQILDIELTEEQLKLCLPQNQKYSLSFRIETPAANGQLLIETMNKKCQSCQNGFVQFHCLICKKYHCQQCQSKDSHRRVHGDFLLLLSLRDANLIAHRSRYHESSSLYFDDFMFPFEMRKSIQWIPLEEYKLDEVKLSKILAKFLQN